MREMREGNSLVLLQPTLHSRLDLGYTANRVVATASDHLEPSFSLCCHLNRGMLPFSAIAVHSDAIAGF